MTTIAQTLDTIQSDTVLSVADSIAAAAIPVSMVNSFTFVANFDGTRNNLDNSLSGSLFSTNVAAIFNAIDAANRDNSNLVNSYYQGVGTSPTWGAWDPTAAIPTAATVKTANDAYLEFNAAASDWLKANPGGDINIMLNTASRGGTTGALFSQMVFERGVVDPDSKEIFIAPGTSLITGGVILDTVNTGVSSNAAFVGANNLVFVGAENDYRYAFKALDNSTQPGDHTSVTSFGNHADILGGNDRGIGAVILGGVDGNSGMVGYYRRMGVSATALPADRLYDPATPMAIHSEGTDAYNNVIWSEYGSVAAGTVRLMQGGVTAPTTVYSPNGSVQTSYLNSDGRLVESLTEPGAFGATTRTLSIKNAETGQVLAQTQVDTSADKNTQTISIYNTQTQAWQQTTTVKAVFDDGSKFFTTTYPNGRSETLATNPNGSLASRSITTPTGHNTEQIDSFTYDSAGRQTQQSSRTIETFYDENGTSRLETVTTYPNGIPTTVRNAYDTDGQLTGSTPVENPAATQLLGQRSVTTLNDIANLVGAIQGGRPLPILSSGLHLINHVANPIGTAVQYPGLNLATGIVGGLASLYNLSNALEHGDTLTKVSATLNTLNYVNSTLPAMLGSSTALSPALNTVLNGNGGLTEEELSTCYEMSSCLRTVYERWRQISYVNVQYAAANDLNWSCAA